MFLSPSASETLSRWRPQFSVTHPPLPCVLSGEGFLLRSRACAGLLCFLLLPTIISFPSYQRISVGHSGARELVFAGHTGPLRGGETRSAAAGPLSPALELFNINFGPNSCAVLAEILNVVQVFTPAHAVTVCYCCYLLLFSGQQAENGKKPG